MYCCWVRRYTAMPVIVTLGVTATVAAQSGIPPAGLKIAFIGDQGANANSAAVLELIAAEGAAAVVHAGDYDYQNNPALWDQRITDVLGACYPYFAAAGNHDVGPYYGPGGYQQMLATRMDCLGLGWDGDLGVRSSHVWKGIRFVLTAPAIFANNDGDTVYAPYIRDQLAADESIWRISSWHKLMKAMQVGGKSNATGWGVYEESRRGGAIIATGHEHSYGRTHALSNCATREVASFQNTFEIVRDDPATGGDEGVTFVFYSGLGGQSIRDQELCFPTAPPYGCNGEWASVYALQQNAQFGALFGVFHDGGDPCRAHFYFKDINGAVIDEFNVVSTLGRCPCIADVNDDGDVGILDLLGVLAMWGTEPDGVPDVDGDGTVGLTDLLVVLATWGGCS